MSKRNSREEVARYLYEFGCKLIGEYENSRKPIEFECKCGRHGRKSLSNFRKHPYCSECGNEIDHAAKRLSYEYVKSEYEKRGMILQEKEYKNAITPMRYICSCGSEAVDTYNKIQQGMRCKNCRYERARETMCKNGTIATSYQQEIQHELFGGELNFPVGRYALDIAFPSEHIYIEYDGSGHDLCVKRGECSQEEFIKRGLKRNYYLMRRGWKSIRFISSLDMLPRKEKMIELYNAAQNVLKSGQHYYIVNFDNGTIEYGNKEYPASFGELEVISKRRKNNYVTTEVCAGDSTDTAGSFANKAKDEDTV